MDKMKSLVVLILMCCFSLSVKAWEKKLSIGSSTVDPSAILDVKSSTQGAIFAPAMSTSARNSISAPAEGLGVWDTDARLRSDYNGSTWTYSVYESTAQTLTQKTIGDTLEIAESSPVSATSNTVGLASEDINGFSWLKILDASGSIFGAGLSGTSSPVINFYAGASVGSLLWQPLSNFLLKLPQSDGTNGQVVTTDGAGQLSFSTVSGGSSISPTSDNKIIVTDLAGGGIKESSVEVDVNGNIFYAASVSISGTTSSVYMDAVSNSSITSPSNGGALFFDSASSTMAFKHISGTTVRFYQSNIWSGQDRTEVMRTCRIANSAGTPVFNAVAGDCEQWLSSITDNGLGNYAPQIITGSINKYTTCGATVVDGTDQGVSIDWSVDSPSSLTLRHYTTSTGGASDGDLVLWCKGEL